MKIAFCSDLHLEFGDIVLNNEQNADVLVLAGDILVAEDLHDYPVTSPYEKPRGSQHERAIVCRKFLKNVSEQFSKIIMIAGNHEFYHGKWNSSLDDLMNECSSYGNIHFLECNDFLIDNVLFLGATLWTDMNKGDPITLEVLSKRMNDFNLIRHDGLGFTKVRPAHALSRHRKTMEYFTKKVQENTDKKIVIVSHMAPCNLSIHENYKDEYHMNGSYFSDLSNFIFDHPQIKVWIHGHMHNESDYLVGDTRVLCNPRGYIGYEERANNFVLKYMEV